MNHAYRSKADEHLRLARKIDDCPYKSRTGQADTNTKRMHWMVGWLDARTWHERGSMFRRYGIMDDRPGSERLIS